MDFLWFASSVELFHMQNVYKNQGNGLQMKEDWAWIWKTQHGGFKT